MSSLLSPDPLELLPSARLNAEHDTSGFASGQPDLDIWLRRYALTASSVGNNRTYVWAPNNRAAIAYYSIAPHLVRCRRSPRETRRRSSDEIPAILLARLALAEQLHGRGLGTVLLVDALIRIIHAIDMVGGALIVADAIDDRAARFFEANGFVRTSGDSERLVLKASDARRSLKQHVER